MRGPRRYEARILTALAVAAGAVGAPRVAHGEDCTIIEAHPGERPADADEILAPFKQPLLDQGCRDAADVVSEWESVSRPGKDADPAVWKTYEQDVRSGYQKHVDGDHEGAIEALDPLAQLAEGNSQVLTEQPSIRTAQRLALVGLAMAHFKLAQRATQEADAADADAKRKRKAKKLDEAARREAEAEAARVLAGQEEAKAREAMIDVVRFFETREIQRSEFGGETFVFYEEVKEQLAGQRRAELTVELDDPSGVIYLNGEYADVGRLDAKVAQGWSTIVVRWGAGEDAIVRQFRRELRNGYYGIRASRRFEEDLHTGPEWCCFRYADAADRDEHLASDIDQIIDTGHRIVVVGIETGSRGAVVGAVYARGADGALAETRRMRVPLSSKPDPERAKEVGEFWAGLRDEIDGADSAPRSGSRRSGRTLTYALGGAGLAALVAGGTLVWLDGRPTCDAPESTCPREYDTKVTGAVLVGTGIVVVGVAALLELHRWRQGSGGSGGVSVAVTSDGFAVGWAGRF